MSCGRKIGPFDCCSVVCGDCLELMKQLPDGCVDAVITDPPYGMGYHPLTGQGRTGKRVGSANTWHPEIDWDNEIRWESLPEVSRIAKQVVWFTNWRRWPELIQKCELPVRSMVVWAKDCHTSPPAPFAAKHELIGFFGDVRPSGFDVNVWSEPIIPTWEHRNHPTEKPIALMKRCVGSILAETILDPFTGSGTTLIAAAELGKHFLGFEISPDYCDIARKRIAAVEAQPTLFEPKAEQLTLEVE